MSAALASQEASRAKKTCRFEIELITISVSEEASNLEEVKAASAKWNKKRKKFQGKDSVVIEQNESLEV